MTGYRELLEKELVEAWRTYRLIVLGLLFLALGVSSPVITRLLPDIVRTFTPPGVDVQFEELGVADVVSQFLKNVVQFAALAAILVTMGSVATERERGTAGFVLVKPVTRTAFLAAKIAAIALQFAVAIGLATIGAYVYTALLFQPVSILAWLQMGAVAWLSTMVYASITFLGSTLMRSSLGAAGVGFAGLIVLSLASIPPSFTSWLPAGLIPVAEALALEEGSPELAPLRTIAVSAGIAVAALVAAWWSFRRAEL